MKKRAPRRKRSMDGLTSHEEGYRHLVTKWTLKVLLHTPVRYVFYKEGGFEDEQILQLLELEDLTAEEKTDKKSLFETLRLKLKRLERPGVCGDCVLTANVQTLGRVLNLSDGERELLTFSVTGEAELELTDFPHLNTDIDLLLTFLQAVLKKRVSCVSKWVGETEKQVAEMFDQARTEDAVVLLDEADSFLRDRRWLEKSWEINFFFIANRQGKSGNLVFEKILSSRASFLAKLITFQLTSIDIFPGPATDSSPLIDIVLTFYPGSKTIEIQLQLKSKRWPLSALLQGKTEEILYFRGIYDHRYFA
jgi:hypothetical protein